ncbi:hypothetical protein MAPG_10110 [Magnaporthiopsis poae ATCC 64411]|uniref:Uncharacterized protein n=1 Tax=Magnaporthiopsis poae (strain ATCC 64411 / 73-15) TaxID=644358 RepID=A0A0C4EBQ5_MAGP6|nr:hypothetical protein MAPG_10110 [Magnaporthiopsis poae ATCC 64411]
MVTIADAKGLWTCYLVSCIGIVVTATSEYGTNVHDTKAYISVPDLTTGYPAGRDSEDGDFIKKAIDLAVKEPISLTGKPPVKALHRMRDSRLRNNNPPALGPCRSLVTSSYLLMDRGSRFTS